jgi:hypothetical protein
MMFQFSVVKTGSAIRAILNKARQVSTCVG